MTQRGNGISRIPYRALLLSLLYWTTVQGEHTNAALRIRGGANRKWYESFDIFRVQREVTAEEDETSSEATATTTEAQRGGHLVIVKPQSRIQFLSRIEGPLPYLDRILPLDMDITETKTYKTVRKVWWNTAWDETVLDDSLEEPKAEEPMALNFTEPEPEPEEEKPKKLSSWRIEKREPKIVPVQESGIETIPKSKIDAEVDDIVAIDRPTNQSIAEVIDDSDAMSAANETLSLEVPTPNITVEVLESEYISSGMWRPIDAVLTLGLSSRYDTLKPSRQLRTIRKMAASATGMHGFLSGKGKVVMRAQINETQSAEQIKAMRQRLAAIDRARRNADRVAQERKTQKRRFGFFRRRRHSADDGDDEVDFVIRKDKREEEERRKTRVKEIDKQIAAGQQRLQSLIAEKDVLQRRPNPLWNYTSAPARRSNSEEETTTTRLFAFPPDDLVEEYLELLLSSGRLVKLNHTDLWRSDGDDYFEDDDDDELLESDNKRKESLDPDDVSGSWFLRYGLGEKIGEAAEVAGYKAVTKSVMGVLAKSLSALHGINIMEYSDIRLSMEQPPMPPAMQHMGEELRDIMKRGSKKSKKRRKERVFSDDFIQRDAVVETLISHCQISAPLLKLFPIAWQRAMLGNIITLATAVMADFFEGLEFQILGHRLTFAFTPITEEDMLYRVRSFEASFRERRSRSQEFEAAVQATADAICENMKILDQWHQRALGARKLQEQLSTLIARLVLTLADDVLTGAKMDLWTLQAGGPRLMAGLEYRTTPSYMGDVRKKSEKK